MAHPNIDERRAYVKTLLEAGEDVTGKLRQEVATQFNCTTSAISADVIALSVKTKVSIHLSARMRTTIYERDGRTCQYCGGSGQTGEYIIEHIIPAALGGHGRPYNLVVSCQSCNVRKWRCVWIPLNLESITKGNPQWRKKILELHSEMERISGGKAAGLSSPPPGGRW